MRTKVAKLLDSYLDRTIGAASADEEDDNQDAKEAKIMTSGVSTETEEEEGFRLFVDSKPGSIVVGEGKKRKVETGVRREEESDSESEEEERKKIESVVVEVKPPEPSS